MGRAFCWQLLATCSSEGREPATEMQPGAAEEVYVVDSLVSSLLSYAA